MFLTQYKVRALKSKTMFSHCLHIVIAFYPHGTHFLFNVSLRLLVHSMSCGFKNGKIEIFWTKLYATNKVFPKVSFQVLIFVPLSAMAYCEVIGTIAYS